MKPITKDQNSVESQGITKSVSFGIKASGLHHILGILRNQLYSDKELAVIREYTCNAVDAHVQAGCADRSIEVTFPTKMSPLFKVRDYGDALSDQEIQDVYAFYGESTKRNTNDQIGMLGIGSKAAFAYGDNFVINSFIDGEKHIYNAFIDDTQIGQISKIGVEKTSEENGIEIVVPVRDNDEDKFVSTGRDLFEWYKVRPIVKGTSQFNYKDQKMLFSGDGWQWRDSDNNRYNRGEAMVVMGNIGYPIDQNALDIDYEDDYHNILTENLVLTMGIGDVEISASREKLQYTDFTRKNIKEILKRVQKEISEQISEEFKGCTTMFDAKCLYGSTFKTDSPLYALKETVKKHLVWNGEVVDGDCFSCYNTAGVELLNYKNSYRSSRYKSQEQNTIHCEKEIVVVVNDVGHRRGSMGKILPLIFHKEKKPYLIQFNGYKSQNINGKTNVSKSAKQVEAAWKKESGFDGEMLKLSELPQHKLNEFDGYAKAAGGGSYGTKNEKHSAKCFEFDFGFGGSSWHSKKSDYWNISEVDVENESGVYVIIDKFHVMDSSPRGSGHSHDPRYMKNWKDTLDQAGIKMPKVVAFKIKERSKIEDKDGWVDLFSWVAVQLSNRITDGNLNQAWIDVQKIDQLHQYRDDNVRHYGSNVDTVCQRFLEVESKLAGREGVLCHFISNYKEMWQDKETRKAIKAVQTISSEFGVEFKSPKGVKPTYSIEKDYKDVMKKYAMFPLMDSQKWNYDWKKGVEEAVVNYVNVIDVCELSNSTSKVK